MAEVFGEDPGLMVTALERHWILVDSTVGFDDWCGKVTVVFVKGSGERRRISILTPIPKPGATAAPNRLGQCGLIVCVLIAANFGAAVGLLVRLAVHSAFGVWM
jgi:hypothetical protein